MGTDILLYVFGAMALAGALGVVWSAKTIYSALSLVITVGALAAMYLVLNAQFLFVVQLIVYAGAVMVLFVFIIALLSPKDEDRPLWDWRLVLGTLTAVALTVGIFVAARNGLAANGGSLNATTIGGVPAANPYNSFSFDQSNGGSVNASGNVQTLAGQLFTIYLLPFEITSILLLVAAVGAVYLTRKRDSRHTQEIRRTLQAQAADRQMEEEVPVA